MLQHAEGLNTVAKSGGANPNRSPERRRRYAANAPRKTRKAGENVIWRRIKDNIDDLVLRTGANPEIASVMSRLVLFGHLTKEEGAVARYYAEVISRHSRYCSSPAHTARAQVYDRGSPGSVDEIERHEVLGTISEYERRAKRAKKQHDRIERVLLPYMHGRDVLDDVCLHDKEINSSQYPSIKVMLRLIADEFGLPITGAKNAGKKPKVTDAKLVASSACETLEAAAKRNRIIIAGFDVATSKTNPRAKLFAITGQKPGERLILKLLAHKPMLPESLEAALIGAAAAKGWKEIAL